MNQQLNTPTFELVNHVWADHALRVPTYRVGRINYGRGRSYVKLLEGELERPFRLYTSLTTAIAQSAPMDYGLLQWYMRLGEAEANRILDLTANYGTLMHQVFGEYLISGEYDLTKLEDVVQEFLNREEYYQPETAEWASKLRYDLVAFIRWCQVHQVRPLGVEYVLLSEAGYGTLIDLVCDLQWPVKGNHGEVFASGEKKGLPKETTKFLPRRAIINFKSGRHAFYRNNGLQVMAEKKLWEENFPELPVDLVLNWAPKEWIIEPDYFVKDWQGEITDQELNAVLTLATIRFAERAQEKRYVSVNGYAFRDKDVMDLVRIITAEEFAIEKFTTIPA